MSVSQEVMLNDLSDRIMELEIRYTHQNQVVDELNEELTIANRRIDQLEREIRKLHDSMKSMEPEFTESRAIFRHCVAGQFDCSRPCGGPTDYGHRCRSGRAAAAIEQTYRLQHADRLSSRT